jgi:hypothetical protein
LAVLLVITAVVAEALLIFGLRHHLYLFAHLRRWPDQNDLVFLWRHLTGDPRRVDPPPLTRKPIVAGVGLTVVVVAALLAGTATDAPPPVAQQAQPEVRLVDPSSDTEAASAAEAEPFAFGDVVVPPVRGALRPSGAAGDSRRAPTATASSGQPEPSAAAPVVGEAPAPPGPQAVTAPLAAPPGPQAVPASQPVPQPGPAASPLPAPPGAPAPAPQPEPQPQPQPEPEPSPEPAPQPTVQVGVEQDVAGQPVGARAGAGEGSCTGVTAGPVTAGCQG